MQKLTLIIQTEYEIHYLQGYILFTLKKKEKKKRKNLIAWNNQSVSHDRRCMIREAQELFEKIRYEWKIVSWNSKTGSQLLRNCFIVAITLHHKGRYVCHEKLVSSLVSSIFKTLITLLDSLFDSRAILLQSLIFTQRCRASDFIHTAYIFCLVFRLLGIYIISVFE